MIRSSSPSSFTSVPDHLPNSTWSPAFTSSGTTALFVPGARPRGHHLAFHRLFLGGIRNDDAAGRLLFGGEAAQHDPVVQGLEFHGFISRMWGSLAAWRSITAPQGKIWVATRRIVSTLHMRVPGVVKVSAARCRGAGPPFIRHGPSLYFVARCQGAVMPAMGFQAGP